MSISAGENIKSYTASAGQVLFNFPYPYFDNTDMTVTQESGGTVTSLVYNVDYTVAATGGNPENGCDITLTTGATLGDTVTIERVVPLSQEYDLQEGSPIDPTALNKALDRTVAQSQQIDAEVGRQITHPVTDTAGLDYEAPSVTDRASKALGWDASGNVTALDLSTTGTVGVDTNAGLSMTTNVISAKVDDTTTTFVAGDIAVKDGGVDTAQLAADAVDGTKIADDAIDSEHIAAGAVDFDHLADTETTLTDTDVKIPTSGAVKDYVDAHGVVQHSHVEDATQHTSTATIPFDNTVPEVTEGLEILTTTLTPTSTSNTINAEIDTRIASAAAGESIIVAIFEGSTCVGARWFTQPTSGVSNSNFIFEFTPSSASEHTYSVRVGSTSGTFYVNRGGAATPTLGGLMKSKLFLTEYKQ